LVHNASTVSVLIVDDGAPVQREISNGRKMMVQRSFGEAVNWKKAHRPLDDFAVENCSHGSERTLSTVERMTKMKKVLALLNSPHEAEAMTAARMAMKLSRAWGIDVNVTYSLNIWLIGNLLF
jgi:hypothetical protein